MRLGLVAIVFVACAAPPPVADEVTGGAAADPWYRRPLPARLEEHAGVWAVIVAPENCAPGGCPSVLVLPGGAQNENLARETLRPWAQALRDDGWVAGAPHPP
ncbi:MAG: hypothetical protein AAGH15_07470, partial [Myxococcota bacterium]